MALFPTGLENSQESMFEESGGYPELMAEPEPVQQYGEDAAMPAEPMQASEVEPVQPQGLVAEAEPAPAEVEEAGEEEQALTIDDFAALEDRVVRAVSLVRRERQARAAAEEKSAALEAELLQQAPIVEKLQQEVNALRTEREQVRQRVERLLRQLDVLEL